MTELRPYRPDSVRVERGDWIRASQYSICERCACAYWEHAPVRGFEWLKRLCNGMLVKL